MTDLARRDLLLALSALALTGCGGLKPIPGGLPEDSGPDDIPEGDTGDGPVDDSAAPVAHCEGQEAALPADCATPTTTDGEGPYYRAGVPAREDFNIDGVEGRVLWVSGRLLDGACGGVAGAVLDLWHCDQAGVYDMSRPDFPFRGQVTTGEDGGFCFSTLVPPAYAGAAAGEFLQPHIHCIVTVGGARVLTTQLCFPALAEVEGTLQEKPDDLEIAAVLQEDGSFAAAFDIRLGGGAA
jgi:protocatechuate 3,4-dioxygenase beta subunit